MRVLLWHVHGSWTTAFVEGRHDYLLPMTPERGPDGLGRARTWDWPANAKDVPVATLRELDFDVVILQRPHEVELVEQWTGRRPGRDVPAVYLEHNAPEPHPVTSRHPVADLAEGGADVTIAHVTHFNRLMWDNGTARTTVIEHGIVDPGELYTGELARAAVVINEPVRRGRMVGTDLVVELARDLPIDHFGMTDGELPGVRHQGDVQQNAMHCELARRRAYLHPMRWTSLGLSLLEAMLTGLPVVVLASTEAPRAVPPEAGVVSADPAALQAGLRRFLADPEEARVAGKAARAAALERYGLDRFLAGWDALLEEVVAR